MSDLHRAARESGIPTLVNIHDVNLARAFADRIIGIAEGLVAFDGVPEMLDEEALMRIYRGSAAVFADGAPSATRRSHLE